MTKGIVRRVVPKAFIKYSLLIEKMSNSMDVKYSCHITLNIPFPNPFENTPNKNHFAKTEYPSILARLKFIL